MLDLGRFVMRVFILHIRTSRRFSIDPLQMKKEQAGFSDKEERIFHIIFRQGNELWIAT